MSKTPFSPAPWTADGFRVIAGHPTNEVADCRYSQDTPLIAAAPELLEALKAIGDEVRITPEAPRSYSSDSYLPEKFRQMISAAIAKAEGRA